MIGIVGHQSTIEHRNLTAEEKDAHFQARIEALQKMIDARDAKIQELKRELYGRKRDFAGG